MMCVVKDEMLRILSTAIILLSCTSFQIAPLSHFTRTLHPQCNYDLCLIRNIQEEAKILHSSVFDRDYPHTRLQRTESHLWYAQYDKYIKSLDLRDIMILICPYSLVWMVTLYNIRHHSILELCICERVEK